MVWFHRKISFFNICIISFLLAAPLLFCFQAPAQTEPDTLIIIDSVSSNETNDTVTIRKHSPHRATIYAMILPGLGQAYNRKYWKIPIVYAGFGVMYYFIHMNNEEYQLFKEAYGHSVQNVDGTEPPINSYEELYDQTYLKRARDYYRRNRDLSYILSGVWYILTIIDATVDAHLFSWEVDEDLTFRVEPEIFNPVMAGFQPAGGIRLTLKF